MLSTYILNKTFPFVLPSFDTELRSILHQEGALHHWATQRRRFYCIALLMNTTRSINHESRSQEFEGFQVQLRSCLQHFNRYKFNPPSPPSYPPQMVCFYKSLAIFNRKTRLNSLHPPETNVHVSFAMIYL